MDKTNINISKTRFVSGVQCVKKMYLETNHYPKLEETNEQQDKLFDVGHEIGLLAQSLFPSNYDGTPESYPDFSKSISNTKQWLESDVNTIYEASFSVEGVFAALDILHHSNGERWAIEVKSSTKVKDYHISDASLQYWVMEKSGFRPDKFFLMHINKNYIKNGLINPKELFILSDITNEVIGKQNWVSENLISFKNILGQDSEPTINIGKHCDNPFSCEYKFLCWKHIPEYSVFSLTRPYGLDWELYEKGIYKLIDIPEDTELNDRQNIQVTAHKNNAVNIDVKMIEAFLMDWEYPLHFLDFETIFPAIPILNASSPFQQIPFQYSLHTIEEIGSDINHKEFLADASDFKNNDFDPRIKLIEKLKNDIGSKGSIVTYNATFEKNVLKDISIAFPEYKPFIDQIIERIVDLLIPFRNGWYYHPSMNGSASIKNVLPSIDPTLNYDNLEVKNGTEASNIFESMVKDTFSGCLTESRKDLLRYCELDTNGMVVIWRELCSKIKINY